MEDPYQSVQNENVQGAQDREDEKSRERYDEVEKVEKDLEEPTTVPNGPDVFDVVNPNE